MPRSKGFTLIELLIAITIIAVLSAIAFVTYTYVMKQGRDSKRMSDLRSIQSALEQYYSDQGFYPKLNSTALPMGLNEALGQSPPVPFTNLTGYPCKFINNDCPTTVKTYINALPQDPTGEVSYTYYSLPVSPSCDNSSGSTNKCTSYCLYAKLENLSSPDLKGCTDTGVGHNFALTPP